MVLLVTLIRHGATAGNAEKRYIGARTDEPLSEEGKRQLFGLKVQKTILSQDFCGQESDEKRSCVLYSQKPDRLYASPMRRCLETAEILFDGQKVRTIENFRETDFGAFEGKNYMELSGDPTYQAWIDSNGEMAFPGGESREAFIRRSVEGFREMVQDIEEYVAQNIGRTHTAHSVFRAAAVVHGGTIMAVLQSLFGGDYYSYHVGNGEGYSFFLERRDERWVPRDLHRLTAGKKPEDK
ncbi:MAG: histidine phosphatase family protein [Eubacteriales bacterium]|jgi:alpha-ribazole phosphatase